VHKDIGAIELVVMLKVGEAFCATDDAGNNDCHDEKKLK